MSEERNPLLQAGELPQFDEIAAEHVEPAMGRVLEEQAAALQALEPLVGERYAQSMVESTPRALLAGLTPEIPPLEGEASRRTTFFSRIFGRGRDR